MTMLNLFRVLFLVAGLAIVGVEIYQFKRHGVLTARIGQRVFAGIAVVSIVVVVFLWLNHISFPLNLELMEGNVLQHFQRAMEFKPVYPEPSPEFIALAYNPLYYVIAIPFGWILGANLATLRIVAILGALGCGLIIYLAVRRKTDSQWWGLIAVGLFAAAYRVMDSYLDTAHADSWLLFTILLGCYIIDTRESRRWDLMAVILLTAAFWIKQHGALFAIGGLLFLSWREGLKGLKYTFLYWFVAVLLGPVAYIFAGPYLFGPYFHYFTWEVPRAWSLFDKGAIRRYATYLFESYPFLGISSVGAAAWAFLKNRQDFSIWHLQLGFALLSGLMGSLDPGSQNNIYIPVGTWIILVGTLGLHQLMRVQALQPYRVHLLAIVVTFVLLLYNPFEIIVSTRADENYEEFVALLDELDGNVFAPQLGYLQEGYALHPSVTWVALEDMVRGPGRDEQNHPNTRRLLDSIIDPDAPTYIITNWRLEGDSLLGFLMDYYVFSADLEDRFAPIGLFERRYDIRWPRYLYRYAPEEVAAR